MTTFVTSRGTVVEIGATTIEIPPGLIPGDVTNPTEMRGILYNQYPSVPPVRVTKPVMQHDYETQNPLTDTMYLGRNVVTATEWESGVGWHIKNTALVHSRGTFSYGNARIVARFGHAPANGMSEEIGFRSYYSSSGVGVGIRDTNFWLYIRDGLKVHTVPLPWRNDYRDQFCDWLIVWRPGHVWLWVYDPVWRVLDPINNEMSNWHFLAEATVRVPMASLNIHYRNDDDESVVGATELTINTLELRAIDPQPPSWGSDKSIDASEIRDTNLHTGNVIEAQYLRARTIAVVNGLDQAVTLQLQGSYTPLFTDSWDIGNTFAVAAGISDYETSYDYFPYLRLTAQCAVAPASGDLDAWLLMHYN